MENNKEEKKIHKSKTVEYVQEYNKKRYQRDKAKVQQLMLKKCKCNICDTDVNYYHKQRHKRTKKHLEKSGGSLLKTDSEIFKLL
jgi:hypothetical protein